MEMVLIAAIVFLVGLSMFVNYDRHKADYRGKRFWSQAAASETAFEGLSVTAYAPVEIVRDEGELLLVRYGDGSEDFVGRAWTLAAEELPQRVY